MEGAGGEFGGVGESKRFLPCCLEERVVEEVDGLEAWEVRRDLVILFEVLSSSLLIV